MWCRFRNLANPSEVWSLHAERVSFHALRRRERPACCESRPSLAFLACPHPSVFALVSRYSPLHFFEGRPGYTSSFPTSPICFPCTPRVLLCIWYLLLRRIVGLRGLYYRCLLARDQRLTQSSPVACLIWVLLLSRQAYQPLSMALLHAAFVDCWLLLSDPTRVGTQRTTYYRGLHAVATKDKHRG